MLRESRIAGFLVIVLFLTVGSIHAQGPDSLWHRAFGDTLSDWGFSVVETHDGYFVTAGQMQVYDPDSGQSFLDVYVLKLDAAGDTLWGRTYGYNRTDGSRSLIEASDGNYVVTGYTDSGSPGNYDIYVIKIDPSGNLIWQRTIGGTRGDEESFCVREMPDSSYRIIGTTDEFGDDDVLLAGIASDGSGIWDRPYDIPGHQSARELALTPDGYLIIVGSNFGPTVDVLLMKTETNGDTLWTRTYDFGPLDYGTSVKPVSYHSYIAAGYSQALIAPFYNAFLLHLQTDGSVNWSRFYGGGNHDYGSCVQVLGDSGFVFTGYTASYGAGGDDVWLVKTDANGDTLWTKTYGGTYSDKGREVQATSDGGFIIGGDTNSFGQGFIDLYLVKTEGDPAGVIGREGTLAKPYLGTQPNPFRRETVIRYSVGGSGHVRLELFDVMGRVVKTLVDANHGPGVHTAGWSGLDNRGRGLPAGIYFCTLTAGKRSTTEKVLYLK